jgi:hypothetical protein
MIYSVKKTGLERIEKARGLTPSWRSASLRSAPIDRLLRHDRDNARSGIGGLLSFGDR